MGPEILTGSTRLKAGTVTKLALNMISTISMIQLGKVFGNRMVDVTISNAKLQRRALRMLQELGDLPEAASILGTCRGEVKTALLMHWGEVDADLGVFRFRGSRRTFAPSPGSLPGGFAPMSLKRQLRPHGGFGVSPTPEKLENFTTLSVRPDV